MCLLQCAGIPLVLHLTLVGKQDFRLHCSQYCPSLFLFVCIDLKSGPEAPVHSPFTKRQPYSSSTASSMMHDSFLQDKSTPPQPPPSSSSSVSAAVAPPLGPAGPSGGSPLPKAHVPPGGVQQVSPGPADMASHGAPGLPLQQQQKLKQQKKRASITTKVSASVYTRGGTRCIDRPTIESLYRGAYANTHTVQ